MTAQFSTPQLPKAHSGRNRSFASGRAIVALMLREMATTYGKSPGGYIWAVLEPVAGIAVLTYAFSFLFTLPPLGTSFQLFYATGVIPFLMFTTISNRIGSSLLFSKPLLVYPAVTYVDAILARFMVNLLTELLVFFIVIIGILYIYETRAVVDLPKVATSLMLTALLGLAVGTLNAYLFMRFHIWHVAWALISRPLFIISGVFFMYDALPQALKEVLWFNPLLHCVGLMRAGFYPTYSDDYTSTKYVAGVSLAMILLGLRLLHVKVKYLLHET
jgi:capsular polysaccharide transport system permease protein